MKTLHLSPSINTSKEIYPLTQYPPTRGTYRGDEADILSLFPMIINYLDLSFLLFWVGLLYVYVFSNFLSNSCSDWCQYSMEL